MDYVVLGHATKDIVPSGYTLGGTVTYAAAAAQRMGLNAAVVTAAEVSLVPELQAVLPGTAIHCRPSPQTTTFENIYTDLGRIQYLRARAERIEAADVPADWRAARIVHLGPVAQELDEGLHALFGQTFVGLTPQGWMRQWDTDGRVSLLPWERAEDVLGKVDAVVFSWEDVAGDERLVRLYTQAAPLTVMTLGRRGAVVFEGGTAQYFPSRRARTADSTGAGDVFATAFFTIYQESCDPYAAARFATAAASFSVEGQGFGKIPTREAVNEWLDAHPYF